MPSPTFEEMVITERKRLTEALVGVDTKIAALNLEAAGYKRELSALDAYEAAKSGKSPTGKPPGGYRAPRGSKQETIVALIAAHPDGVTRGQILDELGLKGNKSGEQSISNALNNMKKAGKIGASNGRYTVV